jgi:general secretion pathway protein H
MTDAGPCEDACPPVASRGFTLVELLVCLAVMALLLGLVASRVTGGRSGIEMRAAAQDMMTVLRETRSHAIGLGTVAVFRIDVAHGGYRADTGAAHRLPAGIAVSLVPTEEVRPREEDRQDRTRDTIRFFADGSSTGGRLHLARDDRHLAILVDWVTGRVSLDDGAR